MLLSILSRYLGSESIKSFLGFLYSKFFYETFTKGAIPDFSIWKIINHDIPDDFVVATGIATSIREMCNVVFKYLGMNYLDYVVQNPAYMRAEELPYLRGDATKAKTILGWQPEQTFEELMHQMVDFWMIELQKNH